MGKLKTCQYCQKIHDSSIKCGGKRSYYREKNNRYTKDKDYLSFIKSKQWLNKSVEIKLLDNYNCLVCKSLGLNSPTYLEVHHIEKVRMNNDNRLDNNNLITLCINHHKQSENGTISSTELHKLIEKYRNKEDDRSDLTAL